jgi:hypothetical protein
MGLKVSIQRLDDGDTVVSLETSPLPMMASTAGTRVELRPLKGTTAKARGAELVKVLRRSRAVKSVLDAMVTLDPVSPIYLRFAGDAEAVVDRLPWEQLYATPPGFFALDARWPIARIPARTQDPRSREYRAPFAVVAILSAAERDGLPQFEAIADAVEAARGDGLPVTLHVLTGQREVHEAAKTRGVDYVTVDWIGTTPAKLSAQIKAARPAILHILCHGASSSAEPGLSIATRKSITGGPDAQHIYLGVAAAVRALQSTEPWLVVLAACESANSRDTQSLTRALVESGAPAVIGMRRIVDLSAIDAFCGDVYPELLRIVREAVSPDKPATYLEWAPALTVARQNAAQRAAAADESWADAVIYLQDEHLEFVMASADAEQIAELEGELAQYRVFLGRSDLKSFPEGLVEEARQKMADIRAKLKALGR